MAEETLASTEGTSTEPKKLQQSVEITTAGACKKHVKVTVQRQDIDELYQTKMQELMKDRDSSSVRGFRPGKAPKFYIEKRYKKYVMQEVQQNVLMASLQQLADETDLAPLAPPDLNPNGIEIPEEGDFIYEFNVEVRPDFDIPDYKSMKLKRPIKTFTDADIAKAKKETLKSEGKVIQKDDQQPVAPGDVVDVLIETVHGNSVRKIPAIIQAAKKLVLNDAVVEGFDDQIAGAKKGETRNVKLKLGENTPIEELRGKETTAKVTIRAISSTKSAELTQDYLAEKGFNNEEQFDEYMSANLNRNFENQQRQALRKDVITQLGKDLKIELPQDLVVRQARRSIDRMIYDMKMNGASDAQLQAYTATIRQNALENTRRSLADHFILQKVAELEKIEIEDTDIEGEISRLATSLGVNPRKLRAQLDREGQVETLATELMERRALDVVLNNATYEDYEYVVPEADSVASIDDQAFPGQLFTPEPPAEALPEQPA